METRKDFWNDSVGYIIYPETFKDGNGDGIGDIPGIISRLDYLRDLGVNLLWICPLFASPMDDNGYDVSDYYKINPLYGTEEDFKQLLEEAHKRGLRVIIDFVLNHTSDEHPWFQKALEDPNSKERGYYFFRRGKRVGDKLLPPNNWKGFFSTSVWENVEGTDDFYLHIFSKKMPDVDWSNPELRDRYYEIANYYLDMGVDGFRLDALAHLAKDLTFADSTLPTDEHGLAFDTSKFSSRPEVFDYLREFKTRVLAPRGAFAIGEVGGGVNPEESLRYSDRENGVINMVFNFDTAWCNGAYGSIDRSDEEIVTDVIALKRNFLRWYEACYDKADMPLYWCNHDHPRVLSQYGSTKYRNESAKALLTILLFMYGTPFIYNGEEIGMSNADYDTPEAFFRDVSTKNEVAALRERGYSDAHITHYLRRTSRLNARTPMQWNSEENAGFGPKVAVAPVNKNYKEGVNVLDQMKDPWSIINFYQYAILKRRDPEFNYIVRNGRFHILDFNHPDVFAYMHETDRGSIVVIASMRPYTTYFSFYHNIRDVVLHNYGDVLLRDHVFELRPFESFLLKV